MTNKNGTVVPAAQELETFLPVDSANGVTKWVKKKKKKWINQFTMFGNVRAPTESIQ